ncbi:hypothetical protein JFU02_02280 [Bacillus sp. TH13]|nr:hypothetical protein [Bacillus sp. TH13]
MELQKKLAEKELNLLQKQIGVAKQKLQKEKNTGFSKEELRASEIEIQQIGSQIEMKKFEVEKAM